MILSARGADASRGKQEAVGRRRKELKAVEVEERRVLIRWDVNQGGEKLKCMERRKEWEG